MHYQAKGLHNRHFELFDGNDNALGKLDYTSWFTINSDINLPTGKVYKIASANIWQTAIEITSEDLKIASLKFNWKGQIILSMEDGPTYIFRRKGFFHSHFALFNEHDHELITIDQKFNLGKLSFNYAIETDDNYKEGKDTVLILILIYCANYFHHYHAA